MMFTLIFRRLKDTISILLDAVRTYLDLAQLASAFPSVPRLSFLKCLRKILIVPNENVLFLVFKDTLDKRLETHSNA